MNSHPHIAAIDFDSQSIQVAVGTRDTTTLSQPLLRADAYPNESIRRGTVIEHNGLSSIVGQILRTLDTAYQHKVPLFIGVHPSSLVSRKVNVSIPLFQNNQARPITDSDCETLTKKAQAMVLTESPNCYILNTIPRQYTLDNTRLQVGAKPTGYQASKLSCDFMLLTCMSQDVSDFVDVFEGYHTDIYEVFATPLTTALLVTSQKQRILGCGVLYISSEVTSFIIFEDGQPSHCATFPIGIEDVVSDVAVGLQINIEKARALLSDPARVNDEQPSVRKRFAEVVGARYMDITERIERALTSLGHPVVLPAGIITITTSIQLHSICDAIYNQLKVPTRLWEGDIPSAQSKKRNRDLSIIGAYSIICSSGNVHEPVYSSKHAFGRIFRDFFSNIRSLISRFLSYIVVISVSQCTDTNFHLALVGFILCRWYTAIVNPQTIMPQYKPEVQTFAKIKVIGVGGSGQNAVDHMIDADIDGVEYVCINTDTQHLDRSRAQRKIHIGKNLTKGVGSGMNPEIGEKSAEETKAEIQEALKDADMVFVACGMGGGTGTGASPFVARMAREQGVLTVGVVTRPFSFEGDRRADIARLGIETLQREVDALIVISNDRLLAVTDRNTSYKDAFAMCDDVLLDAVKSIADIISERQTINIDFADVRAVLSNAGSAYVGIGLASGEDRATQAAHQAINSSLLDVSIAGAKGVLLTIATAPEDLGIFEVNTIAKMVNESIDSNARFIFGPVEDEKMKKGDLKVTIVATGFDAKHPPQTQHTAVTQPTPVPVTKLPEPVLTITEPTPMVELRALAPVAPDILQQTYNVQGAPTRFIPELIAPDPIEPRFVPGKTVGSQSIAPDKPAFSGIMPSDTIMPTFQPDTVDNAPKPLEVLDDSAIDDDWNSRFPAFIRRNK